MPTAPRANALHAEYAAFLADPTAQRQHAERMNAFMRDNGLEADTRPLRTIRTRASYGPVRRPARRRTRGTGSSPGDPDLADPALPAGGRA